MTLLEVMMASLVLMLGTSAAAQLWSHGLRSTHALAQREERLHRLDALLMASEGMARELAASQEPATDCPTVMAQLLPLLQGLPPARQATLSQPPSPPGTLHLRWEADGLRRERLLSGTALGLCREETDET
jgi:hypothetical protein